MIPKFVYAKTDRHTNYLECIDKLFSQLKETENVEYYFSPFVLFCGTTLEYMLNDLIVEYCSRFHLDTEQRKYAESIMSMGFNAKLTSVVPIITGNEYKLNLESTEYKTLCEIISRRNQIAHGKDFYIGLEPEKIQPDKSFTISLKKMGDKNVLLPKHDKESSDFRNAIENFYQSIFLPYFKNELSVSSLTLKMERRSPRRVTVEL